MKLYYLERLCLMRKEAPVRSEVRSNARVGICTVYMCRMVYPKSQEFSTYLSTLRWLGKVAPHNSTEVPAHMNS